jgi:ATP-dependent Clp protease ATP-binding subunit ClpC
LQILDDGRLTDGQGRVVDFRNTVVIMTSNVGTEFASQAGTLGFLQEQQGAEESQRQIEKALKKTFRPEFINRVDEIIIFNNLTVEDVEQIVDLQIQEIAERLEEQGLQIELTSEARKWLARQGFDPQFGARPLRRTLQRYVESPLSIQLLRGEFHHGDRVLLEVGEDGLIFQPQEPVIMVEPQREEMEVPSDLD